MQISGLTEGCHFDRCNLFHFKSIKIWDYDKLWVGLGDAAKNEKNCLSWVRVG